MSENEGPYFNDQLNQAYNDSLNGHFTSGTPDSIKQQIVHDFPSHYSCDEQQKYNPSYSSYGSSSSGSSYGGSSHGGCFVGSTKILTPSGQVRIDSLKKGDVILSWSEAAQELVERRISAVKNHKQPKTIWVLDVDDMTSIEMTANHKFLTQEGWKAARLIKAGDFVLCANETVEWKVVKGVAKTNKVEPVFNLITEGDHNYVAGGALAHNFSYFRKTRTALHQFVEKVLAPRTKARQVVKQPVLA